jgi:NAD(P)-dependent dehydrogenase (short-subunit alcohol dehydrogenase family)
MLLQIFVDSEDGLEFSFATNVMGYFLLSRGLLESLEADGTPARIVNVASLYAGGTLL